MEQENQAESGRGDVGMRAASTTWALAGLALSMLLSSLGTSIANVALPTLSNAFGASFQAVQWVVLAYLLGVTGSIVTVGRLGDLYGRRRLLVGGLLLFVGAAGLGGLSPSLWLLILARGVQGVGAAILMALTLAFVAEVVPKERTGGAMGLLGTTSAIGTALGPSVGGVLIDQLGWRAIFFVQVPVGLLALLLALRFLPVDRAGSAHQRVGFDHVGTLLLASTLAAYSLAVTLGRGDFGPVNAVCLAAAALGAILFVLVERRVASPLVQPGTFRDPALGAGLTMSLLVSTVLMATLVVGPFYLSLGLGLGAGPVGMVMSFGPLVAALTGVPAGRLVDRLGTHRTTIAGLVGVAVGAAILSVTPERFGVVGYVAPVVVLTASYALFQAANNTGVLKDLSPARRGVVSGMLTLSRNLGLITGASLMGAVFAAASGHGDIARASSEDVAMGMRVTFALATALIVVALGVGLGGRALAARHPVTWILPLLLTFGLAPNARAGEPTAPQAAAEVRVVGLVQIQHAHAWLDGAPDGGTLLINRARAGVTGNVFGADLRYLLVADFGQRDVQLLYATLDYTVVPGRLSVRAGQFKRPFSRSFLTSSSQLSMIDRPLPVSAFGDNSDIGLLLHNGDAQPFEYAAGLFGGSIPGAEPDPIHPVVALRVGGKTGGLKGYTESDLEGGAPRFGLGGAVTIDLGADAEVPVRSVVDALVKAHGFSLTSAVYVGARQDGAAASDLVADAIGHSTQVGYVIAHRVEPVVRYSFLTRLDEEGEQHDVAGGLNLFLRGHALKLQSDVGVRFGFRDGEPVRDVSVKSQVTLAL